MLNAPLLSSGLGRPVLDLDFRVLRALPSAMTFSRASVLNDFGSDGLLKQFASGAPAMPCYDQATLRNLGLGLWRSNNIQNIHARDLGSASWTKTGITVTTVNGIDGTSAASRLTLTSATGTVAITPGVGSFPHVLSCFARIASGSPTLSLSMDNGATTVDCTASLSAAFSRVPRGATVFPVGGGLVQTNNAPILVLAMTGQIGDAIDIDYVNFDGQNAGVTFVGPSPPVLTTTVTNQGRSSDSLSITLSSIPGMNADSFTAVLEFMIPYWLVIASPQFTAGTGIMPLSPGLFQFDDGTNSNAVFCRLQAGDINSNFGSDINWSSNLGGTTPVGSGKVRAATNPGTELATLLPTLAGAFGKVAVCYDKNTGMGISFYDGQGHGPTLEVHDKQPGFTAGQLTRLLIGTGNTVSANSYLQRFRIYPGGRTGSARQAMSYP